MRFAVEVAPEYAGKAYRADGSSALAYVVKGWELGPTLDGDDVERTGFLVISALGDDYQTLAVPDDLTELPEDTFCRGCGQTGSGCAEHLSYVERKRSQGWANPPHARAITGVPQSFVDSARKAYADWLTEGILSDSFTAVTPWACSGCRTRIESGETVTVVGLAPLRSWAFCPRCVNHPGVVEDGDLFGALAEIS